MATPPPSDSHDMDRAPPVDPTKNVLDLVAAAIQRQDDLREAADSGMREAIRVADRHVREIAELRAEYDSQLRRAETARIDAIRAVDVGAVARDAEVSAVAATALAAQVQASAEALRTQVSAAATAATVALSAEIEPLKKDIADLRRAQYEAQGVKSNVGESRQNIGAWVAIAVLVVLVVGLILTQISRS